LTQTYCYSHPRPAVTADVVLFRLTVEPVEPRVEVLLVRRGHPPFAGCWALPGGFVEPAESPAQAAQRELLEETGLALSDLTQVGTFGDPGRDPRGWVVSAAYAATVGPEMGPLQAGDDASDVSWWPIGALPQLAFDHASIVKQALRALGTTLAPIGEAASVESASSSPAPDRRKEKHSGSDGRVQ